MPARLRLPGSRQGQGLHGDVGARGRAHGGAVLAAPDPASDRHAMAPLARAPVVWRGMLGSQSNSLRAGCLSSPSPPATSIVRAASLRDLQLLAGHTFFRDDGALHRWRDLGAAEAGWLCVASDRSRRIAVRRGSRSKPTEPTARATAKRKDSLRAQSRPSISRRLSQSK
jgi:hypothetical protein